MNVLGISGIFGHDAAACLSMDGKIIAFAEEERFSRKRFSFGDYPIKATLYCLQEAKIDISAIDILAVSINPELDREAELFQDYGERFLMELGIVEEDWPIIEYWDHHLCHAASSYYSSGYKQAISIVLDGNGERNATSIFVCEKGEILEMESRDISQSLGHFYKSVCMYNGLGRYSEGKLMGLAAYGDPIYKFSPIEINEDYGYFINLGRANHYLPQEYRYKQIQNEWLDWLEKNYGEENLTKQTWSRMNGISTEVHFSEKYKNLAASAQEILNQMIISIIRYAINKYQIKNICISGGVGLNCSTNGYLTEQNITDLYIIPVANDAGGALGACYLSSREHNVLPQQLDTVYLGPDFTDQQIIDLLDTKKIPYQYINNVEEFAAKKIALGKIIGWFQGRMEMGPRALGNRSIVALPNSIEIRDKVNIIKGRESWRPLSPSIIEEDIKRFVDFPSKFMLRGLHVKDLYKKDILGAVHVDGTARVQTVSREDNEKYYKLLEQVKKETGVGAVLNTSFNIGGEPLVCNPRDAIKTFYDSELDYLIMGNIVLSKSEKLQ